MGWLWTSRPTEEQAALLRRRCASRVTAHAHCVGANKGNAGVCDTLATDVVLCRATVLCTEKASAFMVCATTAVASAGSTTGKECDKEAEAMRRCVRAYALPAK
jgi:hypothetical protein